LDARWCKKKNDAEESEGEKERLASRGGRRKKRAGRWRSGTDK
jgi:hypothetical protein